MKLFHKDEIRYIYHRIKSFKNILHYFWEILMSIHRKSHYLFLDNAFRQIQKLKFCTH